jgi:hypothetical protein
VSVLSRMAKLAIAAETVPGVYEPPAFTVTYGKGARYHQKITPLRDRALRGSDSAEQDLLQGPEWCEWTIPSDGYPDLIGWYLRALIGPDTCTPGITTLTRSATQAGAEALSLGAEPAPGAVLMAGAAGTLEYARAGVPSGSGPFAVPLATPLRFAHGAGEPVASQSAHVFAQDTEGPTFSWPRYSLTMDDGTGPLGWPGCVFGSLVITITKDGFAGLKATASGFPPAPQDTFAYDASPMQPMQGWQWGITQGVQAGWDALAGPVVRPLSDSTGITVAVPSTRGLAMSLSLHRNLGIFPTVAGQQHPLGIWPGALMADGTYTAIFEDASDMDVFTESSQEPAVHTLTQPVLAGGCSLSLTMPRSGWWDGEAGQDDAYLKASFKLSGLAEPVGGAAFTATLVNYWPAAY